MPTTSKNCGTSLASRKFHVGKCLCWASAALCPDAVSCTKAPNKWQTPRHHQAFVCEEITMAASCRYHVAMSRSSPVSHPSMLCVPSAVSARALLYQPVASKIHSKYRRWSRGFGSKFGTAHIGCLDHILHTSSY